VVTVDTDLDVIDFNDGVTSLREAIFATNIVPGADEIVFDFGHDGPATILLEHGELEITDELSITGDGLDLLTIDAQQQSRVFNITAETGDFTLAGMTMINMPRQALPQRRCLRLSGTIDLLHHAHQCRKEGVSSNGIPLEKV